MDLVEEAIIYATILHQGRLRKERDVPFILHPLEVAQILATMTKDRETIAAGILHDVVEDTDGTLSEIQRRFGKKVADLVESMTEDDLGGENLEQTWERRKEMFLARLRASENIDMKMVALSDTLSNMRALARDFNERGEAVWSTFHQKDSSRQCWYYRSVVEFVELELNKTGAFKELVRLINDVWPGTIRSEKARYRQYKEVSMEGCRLLGQGLKGQVYRYNDELIVKVNNHRNTYSDVEREIALTRRAFVLGVPTAISFGIVSVGDRYGAMYELVDSELLSSCIRMNPSRLDYYAQVMAELARTIHGLQAEEEDHFPDVKDRFRRYVDYGIGRSDEKMAEKCRLLIDQLPQTDHLVHGDFHTSNVFLKDSEPMLIDLDRLSTGNPIFELADMYLYYDGSGKNDPNDKNSVLEIPYGVCRQFYSLFLEHYLGTKDPSRIQCVRDRASLLGNLRSIHKYWKKGKISKEAAPMVEALLNETREILERVDSLECL